MYYRLLGTEDLSVAMPIANGLTFLFTGLTAALKGEKIDDPVSSVVGAALVLLGVTICYCDS